MDLPDLQRLKQQQRLLQFQQRACCCAALTSTGNDAAMHHMELLEPCMLQATGSSSADLVKGSIRLCYPSQDLQSWQNGQITAMASSAELVPVMRSSWQRWVASRLQAGVAQSLTNPVQDPTASWPPSDRKAQATSGRSSPSSLLCVDMLLHDA